jgi:hypothetical protein
LKVALTVVLVTGLLCGCASVRDALFPSDKGSAIIAPNVRFTLSDPNAFGIPADVEQMMVAHYAGRKFVADVHLQIRPGEVDIVAMDGFGRRLATINWSSGTITFKASNGVPPMFSAEQILANMEIIFASDAVVAAALQQPDVSFSSSISGRAIARNGTSVLVVKYDKGQGWNRVAHLQNLEFGYSLDVNSVQLDR